MCKRLRKSCFIIGSVLSGLSFGYSEGNSPEVVSQGGPLGATSIGEQDIDDKSSRSNSTSTSITNMDERKLLLQLQQQVQQLQGQLQQLKTQQTNFKNTSNGESQFTTYSSRVDDARGVVRANPNASLKGSLIDNDTSDILENISPDHTIVNLGDQSLGGVFNKSGGIDVGGAPPITTQGQIAFLGSYSGNNSIPIGMISSNLFASTLMGQRSKFDDYSVFFGGFLETDAQVFFGSQITKNNGDIFQSNGQNIYLTAANLYFLSNLGHYVTAQFDFDTNESGGFDLGNAFVIFGNLDTSPFFVTAGRNKLSVGSYGGGGTLTNGIIKSFLSPGQVTNVSLNYKSDTINANVAVFGSDDRRANFSTGLFYADSLSENLAAGFNVGYVFNMAGAGNSALSTFLESPTSNNKNATIGAFNLDANLGYVMLGGFWQIQAGWATTTNAENFNGSGNNVLAGAWYTALNYSLELLGRNTNFGASYGQSYNAADIPMAIASSPISFGRAKSGIQNQFIVSAQRAYFDDNVLFGPEYAYQKLYGGQHMNTITIDLSVYV
ncbi:DUF3573 domain-containing protein [Allofrancisella guangzhouensis]|uniref:Membrane protein n=1 Tax=Allofrancisella guangzhouensis TaxID=594679 RepID=A0A0A8E655_9GAMM|nr:DUF3573 domain-containing protein [Allofrancisella guangzhouensis]AJC49488.1 membrane protein [Allofrancisella guangzhouensis]MBK2027972.1 DUF3573 domain-containing protein [Allofrancisella guangzhouensis]MBK2043986.1 DUF3573 domain-containing protein [Allofrancisella guangzhouensis]MBK2045898.1 DUF3573 domain-containing protein [Allofrancisella guangzhouensis]